jgi:hypothetical protein
MMDRLWRISVFERERSTLGKPKGSRKRNGLREEISKSVLSTVNYSRGI